VETDVAVRSHSYREFDVKPGSDDEKPWIAWFQAHNIPFGRVPYKGWAARDVRRNTVSVLVFDWDPDDQLIEARVYVDRDDDGNLGNDVRLAVLTVQLESKPLPFPES
jgi:hypothetical protein